jgi:hypothetical protein
VLMTLGAGSLLVPACATDANDVTGCRELEYARCDRAMSCGIDLQGTLPIGSTPEDAITACQLFYQDACLHGFATTITIDTRTQFTPCLNAITSGDCNTVVNPQSNSACAWLVPPDAGVDAGVDVDTGVPDVIVINVYPDATVSDGAADALAACYQSCDDMCATGDSPCIDSCETGCQGM